MHSSRSISRRRTPTLQTIACTLLLWSCSDSAVPAAPVDSPTPVYLDALSAPSEPSFEAAAFTGSDSCAACHPSHAAEWRTSNHASAMVDPVFRALVELQRLSMGRGQDRFCTQCHSAIGTRSGEIVPGFAFDALSERTLEGVSCESCHRATELARDHNSGHVLSPSMPVQGPFEAEGAPHPTVKSELLVSSRFCAGCHDVLTASGLLLESPYREWLASPAAELGQTCQDCHMPTYRGTASILPGSPTRENLHRHWFTGVDVPTALSADADPEASRVLEERSAALLESAAELQAVASRSRNRRSLTLETTVHNLVQGHHFPTGSSFNRQAWLAVTVRDRLGALVYQSGGTDPSGDLYDGFHEEQQRDPDLVMFGSQMIDGSGALTMLPWQAKELRDNRLGAGESKRFRYEIALPAEAQFPVQVEVRLLFRAYAPRLLSRLGLEQLRASLKTTEVASTRTIVPW